MAAAAHRIGSLALELRAGDAAALDPVRAAIRSGLDRIVLAPVQQALDRAEWLGHVVRHRRIEVDLGRIALADLSGDRLQQRIAAALDCQLGRGGVAAGQPARLAAEDEVDLLADFLGSGVLPWPGPGEALSAICEVLVDRDAAATLLLAARLRPLLASNPIAAERLVRQCPAVLVRRIATALAGAHVPDPERTDQARPVSDASAPALAAAMVRLARGEAIAAESQRILAVPDGPPPNSVEGPSLRDPEISPRHPTAPSRQNGNEAIAPIPDIEAPARRETVQEADDIDVALPITAAGAVLLHPFMTSLFASVGLLGEDGDFIDPAARARGVLLLHFVANGREEAPEPDLLLFKLLCGMAFVSPVPRRLDPTDVERSEANALLAAMIGHWPALGKTSVAGLRETFLLRSGRLFPDGEDWRLAVETRGVDVLLDRLPWSIGMVKTRFMAGLLRVEWR